MCEQKDGRKSADQRLEIAALFSSGWRREKGIQRKS
jgi:hypothetical protein